MLPEPETVVLPAVTEDTAPPAPDDTAELAALCRRLIARRPELALPAQDVEEVGR